MLTLFFISVPLLNLCSACGTFVVTENKLLPSGRLCSMLATLNQLAISIPSSVMTLLFTNQERYAC